MLSLLPIVLILALVVLGVRASARSRGTGGGGWDERGAQRGALVVAGYTIVYIIAFAGLLAVLYAVSGLLAILLFVALPHAGTLLAAGDLRGRASFSLAALIVGLPLWLGPWTAARRRVARLPGERDAGERQLFLAAAWATTAIVALFALETVLRTVLTLPGPADARPAPLDGIAAAARLLVYGAAFAYHARLYRREHDPRDSGDAHDLAVYVVAGFGLGFLVVGLYGAIREASGDVLRIGRPVFLAGQPSPWITWGALAAPLVAGGLVWGAAWRHDMRRGGRRPLRVVYLYIALAVAVAAALGGGVDGLYEGLRRLFGYRPDGGAWAFLPDVLPPLLLGGAGWAYHWSIVRRQASLTASAGGNGAGGNGAGGASDAVAGAIAWPRRPGLALLSATGIAVAAPAVISLLWVGLDAILRIGGAFAGSDWWRDRLSLGIAGAAIGFVAWLGPWTALQRAAVAAPARERAAQERRLLLGAVTVLSLLAAIGFTIALLWLVLRAILGETLGPSAVGDILKNLSAALVLVALGLSHGLVLRRDLRLAGAAARAVSLRVVALLAPGGEEALAGLREAPGLRIDVAGYLSPDQSAGASAALRDIAALRMDIEAASASGAGGGDSALLILGPAGGRLYRYARGAIRPTGRVARVPSRGDGTLPISAQGGEGAGQARAASHEA